MRGHERQAAQKLDQWKTHSEERKPLDASPAAITLALLLTDEELDSLEKRARVGETREGRTTGWIRCRKPLSGCAPWGACPNIPRQCRGPRQATADGWRDLLLCRVA